MKPIMKSYLYVLPQNESSIQFGVTYGRAILIENSNEVFQELIQLCDGQRDVEGIVDTLVSKWPDLDKQSIVETIDTLWENGIIEDAEISSPDIFSHEELKRYESQVSFFSMYSDKERSKYDFQTALESARVLLIGIGGLGCFVAQSLVAAGIGFLRLVDHDRVKLSNLNRQVLYTPSDVGKLKTEVAKSNLEAFNPHTLCETINRRITEPEDLVDIIDNIDFVICTADCPFVHIFRAVNQACISASVPWTRGYYSEAVCSIGPMVIPQKTACFECAEMEYRRRNPHYMNDVEQLLSSDEPRVGPSLGAAFGLAGNFLALEVIKWLSNFAVPITMGNLISLDLGTMKLEQKTCQRQKGCAVCGGTESRV